MLSGATTEEAGRVAEAARLAVMDEAELRVLAEQLLVGTEKETRESAGK